MDCLVVITGRDRGRTFKLSADREAVVGRLPGCEVCLTDSRTSRRHCALYRGTLGYVVKDLGGLNGTFLNGARVKEAQLKSGDRLRVGATEMELRVEGEAGAESPAKAPPAARILPARLDVPEAVDSAPAFCNRCLKDVSPAEIAASRARDSDGALLCAECAAERQAKAEAARMAEDLFGAPIAGALSVPVTTIPTPAGLHPPDDNQQPTPARGTPAAPPARRPGTGTAARRPAGTAHRATVRYFPVTRGQQIRTWVSLALAVAVVVICLGQLSDAWLNVRRLLDPQRFAVQRVDVELVGRGLLGVALGYTIKPAEGDEVKAFRSGGPIVKFQYDELARMAKAQNAQPQFEVVYDTRDPQRNCLFDRMLGLPPLIVGLLAVLWGAWDIRRLWTFFRQERSNRDMRG